MSNLKHGPKSLDEQRARIARVLGIPKADVKAVEPQWLKFMEEGVVARIHIGRWRAKAKLDFADLGISIAENERKEIESIINLGEKKLLPADLYNALGSTESAARKCLERHAYQTHWGAFLTPARYQEW